MLTHAIHAAQKAGDVIKEHFAAPHTISYKDAHQIVSEVDLQAEKIILDILTEEFPTHSFFSEEKGLIDNGSDYLWIIDPLDGTTNFTHQFQRFAVSIGLAYQHKPLLGVVYTPFLNELISAQRGKGAFLNDTQMHLENPPRLGQTLISFNRGANPVEKQRMAHIMTLLTPLMRTPRVLGCASLDICSVARNQVDAAILNGCEFYDAAAGLLIALEAGAQATDFQGNNWQLTPKKRDLVIAHPTLHKELLSLLANV